MRWIMDTIKDSFKKFKEAIDKNPIVKRMTIIMGVFIALIILIIIISSCARRNAKPKGYSYKDFELHMIELVKERYKDKEDDLPKNDKDELVVELKSFINDGTIEDISEIMENNSTCDGTIKVINNYGHLLYIPYLDCGNDYKTKTIYDTLTTEENIVTEGNGLYKVDNEYIFKGEVVNNYLTLNNTTYQIIKINEDGTIRVIDITSSYKYIIWDNRYNVQRQSNDGVNDYIQEGSLNSRLKDTIEEIYNDDTVYSQENDKPYFVTTDVWIGKRSVNDDIFDSSIECTTKTDPYPFGLIYPYEYYVASLDSNCLAIDSKSCKNYNYMSNLKSPTWTTIGDKDTTYRSYKISKEGAFLSAATSTSSILIVTTLNKDLVVKSGNGTETEPYIIETFTK